MTGTAHIYGTTSYFGLSISSNEVLQELKSEDGSYEGQHLRFPCANNSAAAAFEYRIVL